MVVLKMNNDEKDLIKRFKQNARPADRVPFIMEQEIISILSEIRDELKKMNKTPVGGSSKKIDTK